MLKKCQKSIQLLTAICVLFEATLSFADVNICIDWYRQASISQNMIGFSGSGKGSPPESGGGYFTQVVFGETVIKQRLADMHKFLVGNDSIYTERPFSHVDVDRYKNVLDNIKIQPIRIKTTMKELPIEKFLFDESRGVETRDVFLKFYEGMLSKERAKKNEGSHLPYLGLNTSDIPARRSDPILVLGEGFVGNIAEQLVKEGYEYVQSLDIAYKMKGRILPRALKSYEQYGDARNLESVPSNSQMLILAKDLLATVPIQSRSKVINSVIRTLAVGGQARLSFKTSEMLDQIQALELLAASLKDNNQVKIDIEYTDKYKTTGYLKIEKLASDSVKPGGNSSFQLPELPVLTATFLRTAASLVKITKESLREGQSEYSVSAKQYQIFKYLFIEGFIRKDKTKALSEEAKEYWVTIFDHYLLPHIRSGNLSTLASVLKVLDGSVFAAYIFESKGSAAQPKTIDFLFSRPDSKAISNRNSQIDLYFKPTQSCIGACFTSAIDLVRPDLYDKMNLSGDEFFNPHRFLKNKLGE